MFYMYILCKYLILFKAIFKCTSTDVVFQFFRIEICLHFLSVSKMNVVKLNVVNLSVFKVSCEYIPHKITVSSNLVVG